MWILGIAHFSSVYFYLEFHNNRLALEVNVFGLLHRNLPILSFLNTNSRTCTHTQKKTGCLEQRMSEVVTHVSDLLSIHPPVNGGIDPKKLAVSTTSSAPPAPCPGSSSPHNFRRSLVDQIGLDIFRSKSKDELCPSAPPPAVR